ncbi:MAG: MFS transporter [Deltaproteobacteria bacterium]|nr:MFS transporter [Deltaproteobacteria bacterium]
MMRPSVVSTLYIVFQFFFNLLLWVPVFYAVQRQVGLVDRQIFDIQSIYYLAFCLMEVPTGFIADRFGFRTSMLLGAGVLVGANLLPIVTPTYDGFLWHFLAVALARSLISGASSAYMYEYMQSVSRGDEYKKVEADARFYGLMGRIAAWAVVGWLMAWRLWAPYWISAINAGVALLVGLLLPRIKAAVTETPGHWRETVTHILNSRLLMVMLQGVAIFVMVRILQVNLYQPILSAKQFDITSFGWSMSLMTGFEALGSKLAPRLRRKIDDLRVVTWATVVISASLVVVSCVGQTGTLVGFCLFSLAAGVAFPVQKQLLNDAITQSSARATALSLESIIDRAVCAVAVLPLGGLVAGGKLNEILLTTAAAATIFVASLQIGIQRLAAKDPSPNKR